MLRRLLLLLVASVAISQDVRAKKLPAIDDTLPNSPLWLNVKQLCLTKPLVCVVKEALGMFLLTRDFEQILILPQWLPACCHLYLISIRPMHSRAIPFIM